MQKQRSPYTSGQGMNMGMGMDLGAGGGGDDFSTTSFKAAGYSGANFNAQQFSASSFNTASGLNGMPFLTSSPKKSMRSLSRQRLVAESGADTMHSSGGTEAAAQRGFGGLPPLPLAELDFNGLYEGDISTIPMPHSGKRPASGNLIERNASCPLLRKMITNQLTKQKQRGQGQPVPPEPPGAFPLSDTDSDSEYCLQLEDVRSPQTEETRWRSTYNYLMSGQPPQRQQRLEAAFRRCHQSVVFRTLLLLLQLVGLVLGAVLIQGLRLGCLLSGLRIRVWRCKYHLRSTMRHLLWRMTNAKASDTLLFFIVVLATPWLFIIGLVGFVISLAFSVQEGLGELVRQLRLRIVY